MTNCKQGNIVITDLKTCYILPCIVVAFQSFLFFSLGTKAYDKIQEILMKTSILNDIKRLPQRQKLAAWKDSTPP